MTEERKKVWAYFEVSINERFHDLFHIKKRELFLGSSKHDDYYLEHPLILANHLKVTFIPEQGLFIEDNNSLSQGILLNGKLIKKSFLHEKDIISLGPISFKLIYKPKESIIKREITNITRKIKQEIRKVKGIHEDDTKTERTHMPVPKRPKIFLQFMEGNYIGKILDITKSPFVIGSSNADLTIGDRNISPKHAMIEIKEDQLVQINDLFSIQGIYVNNEKILRRILNDKDIITIGVTKFCIFINSTPKNMSLQTNQEKEENINERIDEKFDLIAIESLRDRSTSAEKKPDEKIVANQLKIIFASKYGRWIFIASIIIIFLLLIIIFKHGATPSTQLVKKTMEEKKSMPNNPPQPAKIVLTPVVPNHKAIIQPTPFKVVSSKIPLLKEKASSIKTKKQENLKSKDKSVEELFADFSYNLDFQETGKEIKEQGKQKKNKEKKDIVSSMVDVEISFDTSLHEKQTKATLTSMLDKKISGIKECLYQYYSPITTRTTKIGMRFTVDPQGIITHISFDQKQLIEKKLHACMYGILEKKVGIIKNLQKPIGVHYGYTIQNKSKIDFSK